MSAEEAEILRRAKARIEDPEHWCKQELAKTAKRYGRGCDPSAPEAVAWCAVGAVAAESEGVSFDGIDHLFNLLRAAAAPSRPSIINDRRGHRAALAMFDRAIALAEAEGAS